jgi:hypothetical protein
MTRKSNHLSKKEEVIVTFESKSKTIKMASFTDLVWLKVRQFRTIRINIF